MSGISFCSGGIAFESGRPEVKQAKIECEKVSTALLGGLGKSILEFLVRNKSIFCNFNGAD
jgi:hypothetical protein